MLLVKRRNNGEWGTPTRGELVSDLGKAPTAAELLDALISLGGLGIKGAGGVVIGGLALPASARQSLISTRASACVSRVHSLRSLQINDCSEDQTKGGAVAAKMVANLD